MSATILNIDDNAAGRYAVNRILLRAGFSILEAATGSEGAEIAIRECPDLILLDVNLPDTTGFDLCRVLKANERTTAIPVMLISASFIGTHDQIKGLEWGADGYLTEPLEPEVLLAHINALLRMRQAERRLEIAKEEAESANKAKDQFLAVLSHELRTPLSPIITAVTLLTDADLPDDARPLIDIIRRNVLLEARLIDDLLDLTKIAKGKLQMHFSIVDVHAIIMDVLAICAMEIEQKSLNLSIDLDAAGSDVEADSARLQQVIWNVFKNAVKFTEIGGEVRISTSNPSPEIIQISISDSGIGIEPQVLPRIFDAFDQGSDTTNKTFGGLGLGLAISRSIIEAHAGSVEAISEGTGLGATFTIELNTITGQESKPG